MKSCGKSLLLNLGVEDLCLARTSLEAKTMSSNKERCLPDLILYVLLIIKSLCFFQEDERSGDLYRTVYVNL